MQFPTVTARNLAGRQLALPAELAGEHRILLIAFQRRHQALISSWTPFLEQLERAHPGVRIYEMPVLRQLPSIVQAFIDEGMQAGTPDPAARERTLTLYVDKAAFREALALPDEDTIYVLALDGQGEVRWRARGAYTLERGHSLAKMVRRTADEGSESGLRRGQEYRVSHYLFEKGNTA